MLCAINYSIFIFVTEVYNSIVRMTINIVLLVNKYLTLHLARMTRQEDQKHIFNFVWSNVFQYYLG